MTDGTPPISEAPPETQELRAYLQTIWRRKWILLAVVVLIPAIVFAISSLATKHYRGQVLVQIQPRAIDTSLLPGAGSTPDQPIQAAVRLIQTTGVAQAAARDLRPRPTDPKRLLEQIEASADSAPGFVTIRATDPQAQRAADIANAFAAAVVKTRADKARAQIDKTVARLRGNLSRLPPSEVSTRTQLSRQIQRLRALRAAQGNNAEIVEPAVAPNTAVSPRPGRNAALALVIAVLIAVGLVFIFERLDVRVREPLELERLVDASLLSVVPSSAFEKPELEPEAREAFHTLRASLTYFNIDRRLQSILVTSPLTGDGKTTVAAHLARAVAQLGKDVVLVDTDLRHPQVAHRLGISNGAGLGGVLVGEAARDDGLQEVNVGGGRLRVLPAGPPPPNPSELIGSDSMRSLLTHLADESDLVVIDTPPLLVVSDAIPLLEYASGVVLVGRVNYTTRDSVRRLAGVVRNSHGTILGVVATGSKQGGLYAYGAYEAGPNGAGAVPKGAPAPRNVRTQAD